MPPLLRGRSSRAPGRLRRRIAPWFAEEQRSGRMRAIDPELAARVFPGALSMAFVSLWAVGAELMQLAIEAEGLVRRFGQVTALDGLSLEVEHGVTFGLIGPNGAGKTTFIRMVVGLDRPQAGQVRVLGRTMPDPVVLAEIGYMPQADALYPDLTALENLAFFGAIFGLTGATLRERMDEVLALVGLSAVAGRLVEHFSGGMRRRLSLAAALLHRPALLVLDEPTVGVDPELRQAFWEHFATLARQGTTVLVSTHHMDEARRCGRLALMRAGRVLACGTPAQLLRRAGTDDMEEAFLRFAAGSAAGEEVSGEGSPGREVRGPGRNGR
ncbi:ABC transporter ATP-binding protein [Carboxydochorda subterranea]|uniref:ABC transporter ATP-binding protein n=1 Tax=Carboxydichorda subterranea TaxID=3109565 RepID=A0ABZ1C1F3_9FIRM|nr:ABC transporter ATP-binding protein [Limnochorda sp. L945t]WRP18764.1 ABC transporter ATP-binding protein [Limnochorda sp. L945t]